MLGNWAIVAIRNLLRHKLFTAINVLGLAVGLAAALLIAVHVRHELSYDRFHAKADRIHFAWSTQFIPGRTPVPSPVLSLPMGRLLAEQVPGVEAVVQMGRVSVLVRQGQETRLLRLATAGPGYFRMFDVDVLAGDPATALERPFSVVLSAKEAQGLFGTTDVLGRTLMLNDGKIVTVTAVVGDPPVNSDVLAPALVSLSTPLAHLERVRENWGSNSFRTFVLLGQGMDPATVREAMQDAARRAYPNYAEPGSGRFSFKVELTPLSQIHTNPDILANATTPEVIWAFVALAVLLLAIAAINFINLSTARAGLRAREVGLRKAFGARRRALVAQFMGEAVLLTLVAGLIAIALAELTLPLVTEMLGVRLEGAYRSFGVLAALGLALAVLVGMAGGVYPALVLSGFRPAVVLRGGKSAGGPGRLRALLVVGQFSVAIGLAVCTWVIQEQTRYAQSMRLGFERENLLLLRGIPDGKDARWVTLRDRLRREPGVLDAAGAAWVPTDESEATSNYVVLDGPRAGEETIFRTERADHDYLRAMGATLLAGRLPDPGRATDRIRETSDGGAEAVGGGEVGAVVTRSLVHAMQWGIPEDGLGKALTLGRGNGALRLRVVGVVEDVQFGSARQPKVPTVFLADPDTTSMLVVRVAPGTLPGILGRVDALWKETFPDRPVSRQFMDEEVESLYRAEQRQAHVLGLFAGLAIIVACLGLFGLAAFQAERRTKEIGVRKVLGAGSLDIVRLLVWQFSRPVLVANLIAWPVAWFAMAEWLSGFASRISLDPLVFVAVGAVALAIAWVTVAGHALRVASRKPVAALRYE